MMYDHEKSDPAIVAVKPTNKAGQPAAELVEPRAGAEGNVSQQSTGRAQYRETVSQALKRIRNFVRISRRAVTHPRWEPCEHPFGTLKMRMGATHFLMKTLPKVASEMALSVLAYNLTRVINIVGTRALSR